MVRLAGIAAGMLVCSCAASASSIADYDRKAFVAELLSEEVFAPVAVTLLAREGQSRDLERQLNELGGVQVRFSDTLVGYIRAHVPRNRLPAILTLSGLETAALVSSSRNTDFIPLTARRPLAVPNIRLPVANVAAAPLTDEGPYFPLAETGLTDFWRDHPTADGRGIRMGFVDDGFDLLHPAIQRVRTADGGQAAKVVDMVPFTVVDEDNSWVSFGEPQASRADRLYFADTEWRVPAEGRYRGGIFALKFAPGLWYDPEKKNPSITLKVGALWDPSKDRVWIDTDGDRDFANNQALRDYSVAQEIDWFGRQESDADHRIPFGIKIDRAHGAVWLSLNGSGHGTWTGSAASANQLTGGLYEAPAPNARLVDFRAFDVAAILSAAARRDVDVINRSGGLGRIVATGEEDFDHRVVARAALVYGKPILAASEGLPGTIAISDYWNAQMMRRNAHVPPPYRDGINGEVELTDEGTVNNLLAPSVTMPAVSRYFPTYYRGADGRMYKAPSWPLSPAPEGYAIGSNPSCTIAYASGVVASLLSLAKQKGVRYDLPRLTNALFTGAQRLPDFPARVQGHGLIRIDGAWKQLVAMGKTDDPANPTLTRFELAREDGSGTRTVQGYAEEFPPTLETVERSLMITRRGGYARGRVYRLELEEGLGLFELAQSKVTLARDRPMRVNFTVHPQPGHHVTFLRVIDAQANVVMQRIPLQIRVPDLMEEVAPGVTRYGSSIPSHRSQRHSFIIEPGVQAVRTLMEMPQFTGGEQIYFIASRDLSWMIHRAARPFDKALPPAGLDLATRAVQPGPIDLFWENRSRREYESTFDPPAPRGPIDATLTLTHYAVAFEKGADGSLTLHNRLADVTGRAEWLTGASLRQSLQMGTDTPGIAHVALTVPEKTTFLKIEVTAERRDDTADVYAVEAGENSSVTRLELKSGRGQLDVADAKPGIWKIAVWASERGGRYEVKTVALSSQSADAGFIRHAHDSRVVLTAPAAATHVALRIEPAGDDKEGVLIGLTSLRAED